MEPFLIVVISKDIFLALKDKLIELLMYLLYNFLKMFENFFPPNSSDKGFLFPCEDISFFGNEEESFFFRLCRVFKARSFCFFIKFQQDPKTGKSGIATVLYLIQPKSNKPSFEKLKRILGFGDICVDSKDTSYVLFRITHLVNIEIFLNRIKPYLRFHNHDDFIFFDFYAIIIKLRNKLKRNKLSVLCFLASDVFEGIPTYLFLQLYIDMMIKRYRDFYVSAPKELVPKYIHSRLKPVLLERL